MSALIGLDEVGYVEGAARIRGQCTARWKGRVTDEIYMTHGAVALQNSGAARRGA